MTVLDLDTISYRRDICKVKKIISLDTSSVCTGWGFYKDGNYVKSGTINLKNIKDVNTRMKTMTEKIKELIEKYKPDHVVIEDIVVERNWHTFKVLAIIIGSVYGLCIDKGISYSCLSPSAWRNMIDSGKKPRKRDELKVWGLNKVKMITNNTINDDEADAILVGYAYINNVCMNKESEE